MHIARRLDEADSVEWLRLMTELLEKAALPDYVKATINQKKRCIDLEWSGGERVYGVLERFSDVIGGSPNYQDDVDGWNVHGWWSLIIRCKRTLPDAARGYPVLALALAVPCPRCVKSTRDEEAAYYIYDEARDRDDSDLLSTHQPLVELDKVLGGGLVQKAAELLGAATPANAGREEIQNAICDLGHLSGILEAAKAM